MKDVVIPYLKNGSGELETCIALIKKNFPHRNIHVIDQPSHGVASHIDQILKLKWAIENLNLTEEFYLFNDDFFVLEPVEGTPYFHRGTLEDHVASRPFKDIYSRALKTTSEYLGDGSLSYEVHVPFVFNKQKLYTLIMTHFPRLIESRECPLIRSTYGNLYKVGGELIEDVKNIKDFEGKTYLSTTEGTFRRQIGNYIRSKV